jgi:hypothetical protein
MFHKQTPSKAKRKRNKVLPFAPETDWYWYQVPFPFAKPGRGTGVSESGSELVGPAASVRETATLVVLWAVEAVYILSFPLSYAPVSLIVSSFFFSFLLIYSYMG